MLAILGSLLFFAIFLSDYASALTLTVQISEDRSLTSTTTGQVVLDSGSTEFQLSGSGILDLSHAIALASAGVITIGEIENTLSNFTSGDLSAIDMTAAKNIGGVSVTAEKAVRMLSGIDGQPFTLTNTDLSSFVVTIPHAAVILAPSAWDGKFAPPRIGSSAGTAPSGFSIGSTVIEVGSPDVVLLFDKPVAVILAGVTGDVGFKPAGSSSWTRIENTCAGTYTSPTAPTFPEECSISNGSDTKIYTYHFTTFAELAAVSPAPEPTPTPAPSGGGGGGGIVGGGGGGAPTTITGSIVLQGLAYPNSTVNVVLDGANVKKVATGATGHAFGITIPATSGAHSVGIFAVDAGGRQSVTFTFSATVIGSAPTTISNIVLPPTLDLTADIREPRILRLSGVSQPSSTVVLTINSFHEIIRNTAAGQNGVWSYAFDTEVLEEGDHIIKARAYLADKTQTIFSESRAFTVLPTGLSIAKKVVATKGPADFSGDTRVNLIDFSILLFNWGTPKNTEIDLNQDGKVDITDFSILLFHWTG